MSVELAETGERRHPSNADLAYQIIRERLIMLDIRPSEPINDEGLARQLGFGRTPVREALKRLERDRLVIAYPRRGTFATTVDITDLAHIQEIRKQLEPLVAARAAPHRAAGNPGQAVRARRRDRPLDPADDPRTLLRLDVRVHTAIYQASGNPYLEDVLVCQDAHATRIWCLFLDRLSNVAEHIVEHVALLRASSTATPTWRPSWLPNTSSDSNRRCARSSRSRPADPRRAGRRGRSRDAKKRCGVWCPPSNSPRC